MLLACCIVQLQAFVLMLTIYLSIRIQDRMLKAPSVAAGTSTPGFNFMGFAVLGLYLCIVPREIGNFLESQTRPFVRCGMLSSSYFPGGILG